MKKQFLLFIAATLIGISSLMAQEKAGGQRQSAEDRTKATMDKFASFDLKADVKTSVQQVFTDFYQNQQIAMKEMRASGNTDRNAMMEKRKELTTVRDSKLKQLLTEGQYKKWISDIEPTLRPQKPAQETATPPAQAPAN